MQGQEQKGLSVSGGMVANLAIIHFKAVKVNSVLKSVRSYVETMHAMNKRMDNIRIKPDDYASILNDLNKGKSDDSDRFIGMHWDGVRIVK
jgi:hypothetical protein